ncbi:MAG: hypothetical protein AB7F41_12065 [Methylocystis sp.]|uniref:hypothetical protein n=1 Tax=Methylocystis sp. TaxID=1911079 RepID=UPI003D13C1EA
MSKLILIFAAFIGFAALAPADARSGRDMQRAACERDAHKFCAAEEPDAIAVERCLRAHMKSLSSACKKQFKARGR